MIEQEYSVKRLFSVHCPHCDKDFQTTVQRNRNGAQYALQQTELNESQTKFLAWWLSSEWVNSPMTKKELADRSNFAFGTIAGRVSEFMALDLVKKTTTDIDGRRALFTLNLRRATQILNNNGRLLQLGGVAN